MGKIFCKFCGYPISNPDFHSECKPSENVVTFKQREKTQHEKVSELLGVSNYALFFFTESGALCYSFGEGMTNEQLAYMSKMLDIITVDTIQATTSLERT